MSTLGAMVQRVSLDINRDTTDLGDQIRLCIIDDIERYAGMQFKWNEDTFEFTTVADQGKYTFEVIVIDSAGDYVTDSDGDFVVDDGELPYDFVSLMGGKIRYLIGGDENNQYEMNVVEYRAGDTRISEVGDVSTYPDTAFLYHDGLELVPPPSSGSDTVKGRYTKEVFQPTYTWDGSSWVFTDDSFTSEWFYVKEAERLIRLTAIYYLYSNHIQNTEEMAKAKVRMEEEFGNYVSETNRRRRKSTTFEPWGLY